MLLNCTNVSTQCSLPLRDQRLTACSIPEVEMSSSSFPPSTETSLYLHAELLPNIRQITLYVSLSPNPALHGLRPTIQLSESRKAVTVSLPHPFTHITETIKLPARVSETSRQTLITNTHTTQQPNHDYSFRMPIDPTDAALTPQDELTDDYVPWTAAEMTSATRISCRVCSAELLKTPAPSQDSQNGNRDSGWIWKDLPSGNWAEMMDFWHCHKPDPHEENPEAGAALKVEEQNAQVKGYGASSRVVAIAGTVLVDTATFLLAEEDCGGLIKVRIFCLFSASVESIRILPILILPAFFFLLLFCYFLLISCMSNGQPEGDHFVPMGWPPILLP